MTKHCQGVGLSQQYLTDCELREGYDYIFKKVEQGVRDWDESLSDELHQFLDYHVNVIARSKLGKHRSTEGKGAGGLEHQKKTARTGTERAVEDLEKNHPVFCMEYNNNTCQQQSSHEGNFRGRKCIKWHICRRCRQFNEIAHHPETDQSCPRRN